MIVLLRRLVRKSQVHQLFLVVLTVASAAQQSEVNKYLNFLDDMRKGFRAYQYDAIIGECTEMIRLHPEFAEAFYFRGHAYELKGDDDRALADFNSAIALAPDFAEPLFSRSTIYARQRNYDKAIEDATHAILGRPLSTDTFKLADAFLIRGRTYYHKHDYDRAIQDLTEAIRLQPRGALTYHAFYYRGQAYSAKNDVPHAVDDYKKALELKPNYAEAELALKAALQ